jgi:dolichyl-phosphate-mannose-protein mannosyltransferase
MNRRVWVVVFGLALGLRVFGLRYGLPAVYNPDELAIMSRALAFAKWDFNPHNFLYPTFYFYALFAWEGLAALLAVATRSVASFGAFQREFFLDPTRVFVAGRMLTALLGAGTVVAIGMLGARVSSNSRRLAGVLAALLLAVAPLHVLNSHYVKHDVPVTFLIVVAYLAYDRLWNLPPKGGSPQDSARESRGFRLESRGFRLQAEGSLIAAAAITGVAFSTHYYAIFLAIPLAWSAAQGARDRADALRRIAIAAAVSAAVFFLLSPFMLAEPGTALRDIRANRQIVVDRAIGNLGYLASAARYGRLLLLDTTGLVTAVLALAGLGVAARRDPQRTLWLLAFPVPFLLFIASTYPASRYLVPIVPFMTLFAAIAITEIWRKQRLVAQLLFAAAFSIAALESLRTDAFIRQTDTRTLALDYIRAHVPSGATILTQPYSVPLEPTAEVLREAVGRAEREMPTKTSLQIARVPYPSPAYRLIFLGQGMDVDKLYLPYEQLSGEALRREHVAFVVLKRYNDGAPATMTLLTALAGKGRRIAVFSPYSRAAGADGTPRAEPFLHNSDARITGALERPGPVVEIWQIDGPGS